MTSTGIMLNSVQYCVVLCSIHGIEVVLKTGRDIFYVELQE